MNQALTIDLAVVEVRHCPAAMAGVRLRADEPAQPVIEGYAAVFYDDTAATEYQLWDDLVERIMPGAFDRAIREDDVRGLFNHEANLLLGRTSSKTLRLSSDAKGLRYEIDPPETACGRDVLESLRRGDLSGSSFAFIPEESVWREQGELMIREIISVRLYDVGPVTWPAYEATTAGVRAALQADGVRKEAADWKRQKALAAVHARMRARVRECEADE